MIVVFVTFKIIDCTISFLGPFILSYSITTGILRRNYKKDLNQHNTEVLSKNFKKDISQNKKIKEV